MPNDITLEVIVEATNDTIFTSVDDETVLLDLDSDVYYSVNLIGGEIWERIQNPTEVQDLQEMLVDRYNLSKEQAEADLVAFLESLAEEGIVEVRDD